MAKEHFGAVALIEDLAVYAELRMARFGLSPAWRNMAIFGALDETRHTQISLYFPHELIGKDPQYDWAHKAYQTNQWGIIAARATPGFSARRRRWPGWRHRSPRRPGRS